MKRLVDLHTHLDTLHPIVSFRNKIQKHLYSVEGHIRDDHKIILNVSMYVLYHQSYQDLKKLILGFKERLKGFGEDVKFIQNQKDLTEDFKLGIILHVESARTITDADSQLPELFELGIRGVIPIHHKDNKYGNSCDDPRRKIGIKTSDSGMTKEGRSFIEKCNELGMWLDLAHTSDRSGEEILEIADSVMVSHVGIRNLVDKKRNKDIEFLKKISKKNGAVGLIPWSNLMGAEVSDVKKQIQFAFENGLEDSICIGTDFGAPIKTNPKIRSLFDMANLTDHEGYRYKNAWSFFERTLPNE